MSNTTSHVDEHRAIWRGIFQNNVTDRETFKPVLLSESLYSHEFVELVKMLWVLLIELKGTDIKISPLFERCVVRVCRGLVIDAFQPLWESQPCGSQCLEAVGLRSAHVSGKENE